MSNNAHYRDGQRDNQPTRQVDLFEQVIESSSPDQFLDDQNLGLGNYDAKEYWQQIDTYKSHMYSDAAFRETILDMAIYQTKWELGQQAWTRLDVGDPTTVTDLPPDAPKDRLHADSRRLAILELGTARWRRLGKEAVADDRWDEASVDERQAATAEKQLDALDQYAGFSADWVSPHGRMMSARHEASRSKGARLVDNVFGRKSEEKQIVETPDEEGSLLQRGES